MRIMDIILQKKLAGGGASSGDVFTVTVTAKSDDGTNFSYSKDKSDSEIWEAYSNGKFVVCRLMVDVTFQGIHGNFFGGTFILDNISNDEDEGLYAVFMHHGHYVTYNGTTCIKMESLQFAGSEINYGKYAVDFKSPSNQTPFSFLDS